MAQTCEHCGKVNSEKYERGPWKGEPMMLDYCVNCSRDLCNDCMTTRPCDETDDYEKKHRASADEEDDD